MTPHEPQNLRRDNEPTTGYSSVPIWIIVLLGLFFYWGQMYLDRHGGGFDAHVYYPYDNFIAVDDAQPKDEKAKAIAQGKKLFDATCAACHQPDGSGAA